MKCQKKISAYLVSIKGTRFTECLLSFMNLDDSHATYIIQKIDSNYVQYIKRFEDADPFASLAYEILKGHFSYNVNEVAAYILKIRSL